MTRPQHQYDAAMTLIADGVNDCEISRRLGVPRSTIKEWRSPKYVPKGYSVPQARGVATNERSEDCPICHAADLDVKTYSYLLGLYLGDGHIVLTGTKRAYRLLVTLDIRYPRIIDACFGAMSRMRPDGHMKVHFVHSPGCVRVVAYWKHWPCLFPQHGPGLKHDRSLALKPWQEAIVKDHPREFLRGLIHSDGCRSVNRVVVRGKTYGYPRYQLTNESIEIHWMFRRACDELGVRWTSSPRQTYVSRRDDVSFLDSFIGPKR